MFIEMPVSFVRKQHRMMTSSNGNIFRATGHLCGEFTGEFPAQRPVTRSFDVFFGLCLNKRLSKRRHRAHCDVTVTQYMQMSVSFDWW